MTKLRWTDPPREADPARMQADPDVTLGGAPTGFTAQQVAADRAGLDRATRRLNGLEQIKLRYIEQRSELYATLTQRPLSEFTQSYAALTQKLADTERSISMQQSLCQRFQASLVRRGPRPA